MIALQNDVTSARAARLAPALRRRLRETGGSDPDVALLESTLGAWDHRYTLESPAPLLFETFSRAWQRRVAAERFPERLLPLVQGQGSIAARLLEGDDPGWFPDPQALATALTETARETLAEVRRRWGDDPAGWRWERVHLAHWRHPLSDATTAAHFDLGPAPVDGCADTLRNTGLSPSGNADSGAEYRLVVDFSQPDRFLACQNAGNSGQPGSPHYGDGFAPWIAGEYHVVHLRREGRGGRPGGTHPAAPRWAWLAFRAAQGAEEVVGPVEGGNPRLPGESLIDVPVAHHQRGPQVEPQAVAGLEGHPRPGLPALGVPAVRRDTPAGVVGAVEDEVEQPRGQLFRQAPVDRLHVRLGQEPHRHPALVGHPHHREPPLPVRGEGTRHPRAQALIPGPHRVRAPRAGGAHRPVQVDEQGWATLSNHQNVGRCAVRGSAAP